jgi:hypothetical protein
VLLAERPQVGEIDCQQLRVAGVVVGHAVGVEPVLQFPELGEDFGLGRGVAPDGVKLRFVEPQQP